MRRFTIALGGAAAAAVCLLPAPAHAVGDCVSRGEYDRTETGMRVIDVARLYDLYGSYLGDSVDGDEQRRAYRTCWAPAERRVIVWFDYTDGRSVDWVVRDA